MKPDPEQRARPCAEILTRLDKAGMVLGGGRVSLRIKIRIGPQRLL